MDPIYGEFGRRLRDARNSARLTQEALAKRVGLSRTSITNIERGNQHVALHHLIELASAVGVAASQLIPTDDAGESESPEAVLSALSPARRKSVIQELEGLSVDDRNRILRMMTREARIDDRTQEG